MVSLALELIVEAFVRRCSIDSIRRREEDSEHLKQDEHCFIKVSRAVLEQVAEEIALVGLGLLVVEANELVRFQVLQVAHRQKLALVLQLHSCAWPLISADCLQEANIFLLLELVDFVL